MTDKALNALRISIGKWVGIRDGEVEENGKDNCALCGLFFYEECRDCPVREATGRVGCHGTPYGLFVDAEHAGDSEGRYHYACETLAFLKSLLPEGDPLK